MAQLSRLIAGRHSLHWCCREAAGCRVPCRSSASQAMVMHERADAVLSYWLGQEYAKPQPAGYWCAKEITRLWFAGGAEVDEYIKQHFTGDLEALAAGKYDDWMQQPLSAVAGIILADQFSRNAHRGTSKAFALDSKALQWSHHVQDSWELHVQLPSPPLRYFCYMPLMHSEVLSDQELLVQLSGQELQLAERDGADSAAAVSWRGIKRFAEAHRDVVARWGRFPHRNAILGRSSTPEEEAGLREGSIPKW